MDQKVNTRAKSILIIDDPVPESIIKILVNSGIKFDQMKLSSGEILVIEYHSEYE